MGVRVRLSISSSKVGSPLEVNSLLSTGFESEEPEMLVPVKVAETLGFWPDLPKGAVVKAYETAGGTVRMYHISEAVEIHVATEDRLSKTIKCHLVISELEREVLLGDRAIDELEIVIESPGKGLWRFKDEDKITASVEPQYW